MQGEPPRRPEAPARDGLAIPLRPPPAKTPFVNGDRRSSSSTFLLPATLPGGGGLTRRALAGSALARCAAFTLPLAGAGLAGRRLAAVVLGLLALRQQDARVEHHLLALLQPALDLRH